MSDLVDRVFPADADGDAMAEVWMRTFDGDGGIADGAAPADVGRWFDHCQGSPGHTAQCDFGLLCDTPKTQVWGLSWSLSDLVRWGIDPWTGAEFVGDDDPALIWWERQLGTTAGDLRDAQRDALAELAALR